MESSRRPKRVSKRERFRELAREHGFAHIGEAELAVLRAALEPISESTLRHAARASGIALDALVEGVIQDNYPDLERTLCALEQVYSAGDPERSRRARTEVLKAREHAGFALARLPEGSGEAAHKQEVILWLRTWLGNPPLFPAWVAIRTRHLRCSVPAHKF